MQKHWRNWLVTKMSITTSLVTIAGEEGKDQLTTYNSPKCCTGSGFHVSVCNSRCSLSWGEMSRGHRDGEDWALSLFPLSGSGASTGLWLVQTDHVTWILVSDWLPASSVSAGRGHSAHVTLEPPPRPRQSLLGRQMLGRAGVTTRCVFPGLWLVSNVQDRPLIGRCELRGYRARDGNKKTWML